ncbi:MAG TPA: four helix bundle protein [Acidobacteriota bacterium]|nr:four helix bundle protein [Acidobacteriota bacterium]
MNNRLKVVRPDILERTVCYSLRIIKLYRELRKECVGAILGKQLLRCGTSIGANLHEAQAGQSRADFIAKTTSKKVPKMKSPLNSSFLILNS